MKRLLLTLMIAAASTTAFSEQLVMQCRGDDVYMLDTDKGQLFIRRQGRWERKCVQEPWVRYDPGLKGDLRTDYSTEVKDKSFICLWTHTAVKSKEQLGFDRWWYDFLVGEVGWSVSDKSIIRQACRLM